MYIYIYSHSHVYIYIYHNDKVDVDDEDDEYDEVQRIYGHLLVITYNWSLLWDYRFYKLSSISTT